jgi:flagellar M-ring protein FliF
VPGATSNQPPGPSSAPVNAAAQTPSAAAGSPNNASKRESIINYEVDKTIRVVKGATGVIKRLSVAVVVNHATNTDDKGKITTQPLTDQQIEKMTALVRETIGFNQERGDSVNLLNAQFTKEKVSIPEIPLWKDPLVLDLARSFAWPLGAVVLGLLAFLGLIRPAMTALNQPVVITETRQAQLEAVVDETPERPQLTALTSNDPKAEPSAHDLELQAAKKLTQDNPAAVAGILRNWINGETAA